LGRIGLDRDDHSKGTVAERRRKDVIAFHGFEVARQFGLVLASAPADERRRPIIGSDESVIALTRRRIEEDIRGLGEDARDMSDQDPPRSIDGISDAKPSVGTGVDYELVIGGIWRVSENGSEDERSRGSAV
jgi:hypothetical protein